MERENSTNSRQAVSDEQRSRLSLMRQAMGMEPESGLSGDSFQLRLVHDNWLKNNPKAKTWCHRKRLSLLTFFIGGFLLMVSATLSVSDNIPVILRPIPVSCAICALGIVGYLISIAILEHHWCNWIISHPLDPEHPWVHPNVTEE